MSNHLPGKTDRDWWLAPKDKVHETVYPYVTTLEEQQAVRRLQWVRFARAYQNQDPSLMYSTIGGGASINNQLAQWSSRNVIKSAIDTATSKIGKSRPRPVMQTEDGSRAQQKRATGLTQFLDGQFDQMRHYETAAAVFRDGGIFGVGAEKFFIDSHEGAVKSERVMIDEIIVDDADAIHGNPSQLHHRRYVSRALMLKKYPQHAAAIKNEPSAFIELSVPIEGVDLIRVVESWKLPSAHGEKDGKVALTIKGATLRCDEWTKDYFPFVFWRWCPRVAGFWGMGIAEEIYGTQLEINRILRNISQALNLVAVPRVFVQNGSLVSSKIDNNIGALVKYTGQAPIFSTPQGMGPEAYNHLQWLVQSAFEQIGISQMTAGGAVPAGLEAAVAMREYADQTSERFMVVGQRWEQYHLDCAKVVIDLTRDLMEMDKEPTVKVQDKDFLKTIKWSDVDLPEDKYILRMFAANILPTTPAGKLSKVMELMQAGLIPQEEGLKLLDFPDFKAYRNQVLASSDLTDKIIDTIVDTGRYIPPEPQMDLGKALSTAQQRYLEAKLNDVDPRKLAMLNRWMEAIKGMLPATPQAVTPMDPMAQDPMATPEAAPTSPMLPINQPQ